jgi:hypothetical protein
MINDNVKTVIRPTSEALSHADPTLHQMIRYIRHVLDRHDPGEIAHNAALIYLAMFTAFRDAKLLELDWAPSLSLDIGDREYEIVISHVSSVTTFGEKANLSKMMTPQGSDMMDIERNSDAPTSANHSPDVGHGTRCSEKAKLPKNGSSKAFALLDTLIERMKKDAFRGGTMATVPLDTIRLHVTEAGAEATPSKISSWLINEVSRLDHLLVQADKISIAINCCYWSIGVSYRNFCKVRCVMRGVPWWFHGLLKASNATLAGSQHPRTTEKDNFAILCATPPVVEWMKSTRTRARLQKRLQRARKFVILVDVFGEQALQWVPEISVSRLDIVRLEDLQKIATGSIEQKRVQAIKDKLPAPLVNPMTAHKSSRL